MNSDYNMGTRSRIIIMRPQTKTIYLWQEYDGYLDGVGDRLCDQLRILFGKYDIVELREMVEKIEEGNDIFETQMLSDIFEKKKEVKFDYSDDINYEYVVDLANEVLIVTCETNRGFITMHFSFEIIRKGYVITDIIDNDGNFIDGNGNLIDYKYFIQDKGR